MNSTDARNWNSAGHRRNYSDEAARETDSGLAAVIAKLERAERSDGSDIDVVLGQLHAYRREQKRRQSR